MPEAALTFEAVAAMLDEAAAAVGMPPFNLNPHFAKGERSQDRYCHYRLRPPSAAYVALNVEASEDGISLAIDRVPEALEWGTKHLADREATVRALAAFFSGYLVVEHRTRRVTRLTLFQPDGAQEWSFKHSMWPGGGSQYERRLFLPLNSMPPAA